VLVLLHGFTHDSRAWRPQLEGLSDEFTVIAWDAPGAGKSPDPPETFGMGDWADCLTVFLDAVGVQRAHILGLSWGGLLAQELYRRYAGLVRSLILADTYAGWIGSLPEPIPEQRLAACLRDASLPPAEFVPRYIPGMFSEAPTEEVREELARIMSDFHPLGFRLMATALARADTRDLLPTIRVPTLLVWGDADARSPLTVAHQMHDAIPGARLAVISGAGHVSNLEAPVQFDAHVRDFCLSVSIG
jgi:pimeloyl-ACP methyl ester carboxylesterase